MEKDWLFYENEARNNGYHVVCGVDEAGRGPLAGPVFAAAVILPQNLMIDGLNDSKKLSEKKREILYDKIKNLALTYAVAFATEHEIDEINILNATFLAMKRAVAKLNLKPDIVLVDGNKSPELEISTQTIVKGDSLSASIAAASILAKVERDRLMKNLSKKYPEYNFEKHKGYGTKMHIDLIKKYGPCEIHRKSFLKKILGE
ncbi:ribonuclease [Clostridium sp. CAG:557]|jgi:ribonuclease HII|nr:ribonuclease [Clostridium sp. CAG:557]